MDDLYLNSKLPPLPNSDQLTCPPAFIIYSTSSSFTRMATKANVVYGTSTFFSCDFEEAKKCLAVCERFGIKGLDASRFHGKTEEVIGELDAGRKFLVGTKTLGIMPGSLSKESILAAQKASFEALKVDKVCTCPLRTHEDF